ncbi:MAG TPA: efflux RND transporter periplasmic adaptor subunit, partial [Caulobacteraceae bacterium]
LPKAAIAANGAEPSVFVIDHGVAHQRPVEIGQERRDQVAVRSGVNAGDVVVTTGAGTLQDGVAVTIQRAGQ